MKRLPPIVTAVIILTLVVVGCSQPQTTTPKPDIPRYTADQVIAVLKAYSPNFPPGYSYLKTASWSAVYKGNGLWLVEKYGIDAQGFNRGVVNRWVFNEKTTAITE